MGGGDLNMKKHFHPLTIENLERVWKAEDKKKREEERIEELQKELHEERQREAFQRQAVESGLQKKKSEKLDWMYSHQQSVNTDEYLLGKRIDKNVEVLKEDEKKTLAEGAKSSTIVKSSSLPKAGDILAKVKEDPLFLIKKREEDNRRDLVQNPMKMKKMKALLLQKIEGKDESKSKREKRKHQKSSKSSQEESKSIKRKSSYTHHSEHHREGNHSEYRKHNDHSEYRKHNDRFEHHKYDNYSEYHKDDRRVKKNSPDREYHKRHESKSQRHHHSTSDSDRCEREQRKKDIKKRMKYTNDTDSSDDDEMEAKRKEMLDNAKWSQSQHALKLKRHKDELVKEENLAKKTLQNENVSDHKAKFIQKMQVESFSDKNASVEDRIRRNIHSKQRTNAALQKKFTSK